MARRAPRRITGAIQAARSRAAPPTTLGAVQQAWRDAVGEQIASAAEPVAEREGKVVVRCQAAVWAEELDLMQDRILGRLKELLGAAAPTALRFEVGGDPDRP
jgi:predicted nucleic acid-binding Zn ribbon protein